MHKQTKDFILGGKGYEKRILAMLTATMMVLGLAACGATDTKDGAGDTSAAGSGSSGDLIKVGIINNDPNESGYRTANDKDMKNMFTKENGYDASFAYSLKNDEQITAAQKFIQDGVDYLLLSAADTSGWDSVLKDAQDAGTQVILLTVLSMQMKACMQHQSYLIWIKKDRLHVTG